MCLISKWRFPKKAEKDITCYKALVLAEDLYYSPFMGDYIDITKPLKAKGSSFSLIKLDSKDKDYYYRKHGGYIHTFRTIPSEKFLYEYFTGACDVKNIKVFRCVIPKGTKYHEGVCGDYCSKKLIIDKIIPSYKL